MQKNLQDKRNQRSRAALRRALVELMKNKPLARISVKELCECAGVNRSTFYGSYKDVYQLLMEVHAAAFERMSEELQDGFSNIWGDDPAKTRAGVMRVLAYMKSQRELFLIFLQNNDEQLFEANMLAYFGSQFGSRVRSEADRCTYMYHMLGCFAVLCHWLLSGCPLPEEQMADYIYNLTRSHASPDAPWLSLTEAARARQR